MYRKTALAGLGLALAASLAPLSSASASCHADLSAIGGSSCQSLCPGIVVRVVNDALGTPFINCVA